MSRWLFRLFFGALVELVRSALVRASYRIPEPCRECVDLLLRRIEEDLRHELGML
jgi:hypothetical protein